MNDEISLQAIATVAAALGFSVTFTEPIFTIDGHDTTVRVTCNVLMSESFPSNQFVRDVCREMARATGLTTDVIYKRFVEAMHDETG